MKTSVFIILYTILAGMGLYPMPTPQVYYIDYAGGSNSNPGTKVSPWKSHPWMNCGPAPTYTHVPGDSFKFKGGVTWPVGCFKWNLQAGGNSSASDYYGVDLTWFNGGSYTNPLFDMGQAIPSGNHVVTAVASFSGYVTFEGWEIANQGLSLGIANADDAFNFTSVTGSMPGVTVTKMNMHDWISNTDVAGRPSSFSWPYSAGCIDDGHDRIIVDHVTCSDAGGWVYASAVKHTGGYSGACVNCKEVRFSTFHDVGAACFTTVSCHDNDIYHVNAQPLYDLCTACRPHSQMIEDDTPCGGPLIVKALVYNNKLHDSNAGVNIFVKYNGAQIVNNVFWNLANQYPIRLCTWTGDQSTDVGFISNNTADMSVGVTKFIGGNPTPAPKGSLIVQNNHLIGSTGLSDWSIPISASNNPTQTKTNATAQGYTSSSVYASATSSGITVTAGKNQSAFCSIPQLCSDINAVIRGTFWDAGAHQFNGAAPPPILQPPTGVTAAVI